MPDTTRITSAPVLRLFLALMFTSNLLCVDSRCRKWSARWEGYSHFALRVTEFRHFPVNVLPQMGWCNKLPSGSERAPRCKPLILLNYQLYIFFVFLVRFFNMPLCFFFPLFNFPLNISLYSILFDYLTINFFKKKTTKKHRYNVQIVIINALSPSLNLFAYFGSLGLRLLFLHWPLCCC